MRQFFAGAIELFIYFIFFLFRSLNGVLFTLRAIVIEFPLEKLIKTHTQAIQFILQNNIWLNISP